MAEAADLSRFPARLVVDDPAPQRRWTVLLRLPLSVPVLLFSILLQSGIALAIWSAILVRGHIPNWLLAYQVATNRWQLRAAAYFLLLTDQYPPFEGDYPLRYAIDDDARRSRWKLVIWKLVSAIPHFFIVVLLGLTLLVVVPVAWCALLLTGRLPQRLHCYIAGVLRWAARVQAYVLSLTDAYPPFRFAGHAGPAARRSYLLASAAGSILTTAAWSAFAALVAFGGEQIEADVPYDALVAGELRSAGVQTEVHVARVWLTLAIDPLLTLEPYLAADPGTRLIAFELTINQRPSSTESVPIRRSSFSLRSESGARGKALMVTVDGRRAPVDLGHNERAITRVIFEMPVDERPVEFRYDVLNYIDVPRVGETIIYHLQ